MTVSNARSVALQFETYISTPSNPSERRFVLVVYQEGKGKFKIRRFLQNESQTITYHISASANNYSDQREEILPLIPNALEQIFSEGALTISYVEGDALIEFPTELSNSFDNEKLQQFSNLALRGLEPLIKDYAEPIFAENIENNEKTRSASALQLCLLVVMCISAISYFYRGEILPLEWISLSAYCFLFVSILGAIFTSFTRTLFHNGKVLSLCFFCSSAILLMLILGIINKELINPTLIKKEGIIESLFEDTKSNTMRIRLASKPKITYLVSKSYLKETPRQLPQAILLQIRPGFLNSQYVIGIDLIK